MPLGTHARTHTHTHTHTHKHTHTDSDFVLSRVQSLPSVQREAAFFRAELPHQCILPLGLKLVSGVLFKSKQGSKQTVR